MGSHTFEEGGVPPLPGFCAKLVLHTFEGGGGGGGFHGVVSRTEPRYFFSRLKLCIIIQALGPQN